MPQAAVTGRRTARRWLTALIGLTLGGGLLAAGAAWWIARESVPPLSGELRVAGLEAPVEILFDRWGVPHIYARDDEDAWFAVGYLHGRDRLWKLELYRRAAAGRLSEVFGERTLQADRRFRALGLRRAAAAELSIAPQRLKTALDRYAAGVNAYTATLGRWKRPTEFQILGIAPEPWSPLDSLAIGKLMAWRLSENRHGELVRGALTRRFGAAATGPLMGAWPSDAPAILDLDGSPAIPARPLPSVPATTDAPGDRLMVAANDELPPGLEWLSTLARPGASNSWVVAGRRSATGRPLLANDPHLGLEMPSVWYEAHLVSAGLNVSGAMIPGSPFVAIGHNDKIAWGITNAGADVQDFYVEDVDFRRRRYLFAGSWVPLDVDRIEIDVRGADAPHVSEVFRTRHGPLIATEAEWEDVPTFTEATARTSPRPIALRWELRGESAAAFEIINRAATWPDFLTAVRRIATPSLSFVYADVSGAIGYAMSGALPVRARGDGSVPVPGWTGGYEWAGSVAPERLPAAHNPPSGQFVTANAEIDRRWPSTMTRDWTAPFRTVRVTALLGDRTGLDVPAFREIQSDIRSAAADRLLTAVEAAARSRAAERAESDARTALERLRLWDRHVDQRPVVSLFQAFERALWQRTFSDEMPPELYQQFVEYGLGERFVGIYGILEDPAARWWDDIATVDRRESRDDMIVLAAADALLALRRKFGEESNWAWGRLHAAHFRHPLGGGGLPLRWFFDRGPVPVNGDGTTVNKTTVDRRHPYAVADLASYRQIVDVGAWDRTRAVNTTGQSGHPASPHYFDQNALWAAVQDRPFPFSRVEVDRARTSRLLLVP